MSSGYFVGYGLTNGLAAANFTWSSAYTTGRSRLNDSLGELRADGSSSGQASGQTLAIDLSLAFSCVGVALINHSCAGYGVLVEAADNSAFSVGLVTAKAASTLATAAPYQKDTVLQFPGVPSDTGA